MATDFGNADDYEELRFMGSDVARTELVQQRINQRFDELFWIDKKGEHRIFVCCFCDEVLMHKDDINWIPIDKVKKNRKAIEWESIVDPNERIAAIESAYEFSADHDTANCIRDKSWLKGLAFSPRGCVGRRSMHGNSKYGFSSCATCKGWIEKGKTPFYAIVNANYVGCPPSCLLELTEHELALITPVQKTYGYCFTYTGGTHLNMRGVMSFMRVQERQIVRGAIQLEQMGLRKHIVTLLTGKMTELQRKKARKKADKYRMDKVLDAVMWLVANHKRWKDVDVNKYREELEGVVPVVIDQSDLVESENANIEQMEVFSCFMPDSSLQDNTGGFDNTDAFKEYVNKMAQSGFEVTLQANLRREFLNSQDGDLVMSACLLQFPYGVGGPDARRLTEDGRITTDCDHEGYYRHLSKLSQPIMGQALFQLVMYAQIAKLRILSKSAFQVRGAKTIDQLSNTLNFDDVQSSIRGRRNGNYNMGSAASQKLLSVVDACSRALPHSDEAAKTARQKAESFLHYYGFPTIFATITFDDDNSLVMQVLCDQRIDDDTPLEDLTDDELAERAKLRSELRVKFPGMTSINYEMMMNIFMEEVVGWSMREQRATEYPGYFGTPEAVTDATEEQGRKTLHGHLLIWIKGFQKLREAMMFETTRENRKEARVVASYFYDRIASTSFFESNPQVLVRAWDHDCNVDVRTRTLPEVCDDQALRNLRHICGYDYERGIFAKCPHCYEGYTYEDLVEKYVRYVAKFPEEENPDTEGAEGKEMDRPANIPLGRMRAKIIEFQKEMGGTMTDELKVCIDGAYNQHSSKHTVTCFPCIGKKKKKGHKHTAECECRMRLPDLPRIETQVKVLEESTPWVCFTGETKELPLMQFVIKRKRYDLFQNCCCCAASHSKFACNSNISVCTPGPLCCYCFKYHMKPTSKEDTKPYEEVEESLKKMDTRCHEDDAKEAKRVVRRAAFAHAKRNVIGAPFANYLVRNGTRFYFSEDFVLIPLKDLIRVENNQAIFSSVRYDVDGSIFWENSAMHYLCRHEEFENYSVKKFYEKLEVCYVPQENSRKRKRSGVGVVNYGDEGMKYRFINTEYFTHPSSKKSGNERLPPSRGVKFRDRTKGTLKAQVTQWLFPDTNQFKANILTCSENQMNSHMEKYAQVVLTLFLPHRCRNDLRSSSNTSFPYTTKLQEIYELERSRPNGSRDVFTHANQRFLQNIQDTAYNALRKKVQSDELQGCTEPFTEGMVPSLTEEDAIAEEDEVEEELPSITPYEDLLTNIEPAADMTDTDPTFLQHKLQNLSFRPLRDTGKERCGYNVTLPIPSLAVPPSGDFVNQGTNQSNGNNGSTAPPGSGERKKYSIKDVVRVILHRSTATTRDAFRNNPEAKVEDANGTAKNIIEWGRAAGLDSVQQRAFESITAAFILTFYDNNKEDDLDPTISTQEKMKFRKMKKRLLKLKGKNQHSDPNDPQLIALVHGPGGSGKSTVINLVNAYAREYCNLIGHEFTTRTIVVTAMSGVAATLIHGETTHSALGLNRSKVSEEEMLEWRDTRLVIIDEVSFASAGDFEKMNTMTRRLMEEPFKSYGGLNIVFAGHYSQLEPVRKDPVYKFGECSDYHGELNCFIELSGHHRFKDDPTWGKICERFGNGNPTLEDIKRINSECVVSSTHVPPPEVQVATYHNADRDAINTAMFDEYCRVNATTSGEVFSGAIIIFMDELEAMDSHGTFVPVTSNAVKRFFFETVGEDGCKISGDERKGPLRVDPMLKLYYQCPLMMVHNKDVPNGQANGSRVFLKAVNVRPGEQPFFIKLESGVTVRAYRASQIKSLTVRQEDPSILPSVFELDAERSKFAAKLEKGNACFATQLRGLQFPVVSNSATTGHKLQGYTARALYVNSWSYRKNWVYVVLSRVRTMKGLYLREPLSTDLKKYEMSSKMKAMIRDFKNRLLLRQLEPEEYDDLMNDNI